MALTMHDIDRLVAGAIAPSGAQSASGSNGSVDAIVCSICDLAIGAGDRRWKTCRQHFACGAAFDKCQKMCAKDVEAKAAWEALGNQHGSDGKAERKDVVQKVAAGSIPNGEIKSLVIKTHRTRLLRMRESVEEFDELGFKAHMRRVRGWPKKAVKAKWREIQRSPHRFPTRKLPGGHLMVWVPQNRKMSLEDVLGCDTSTHGRDLSVDGDVFQRLMFGQDGGVRAQELTAPAFGVALAQQMVSDSAVLHMPLVDSVPQLRNRKRSAKSDTSGSSGMTSSDDEKSGDEIRKRLCRNNSPSREFGLASPTPKIDKAPTPSPASTKKAASIPGSDDGDSRSQAPSKKTKGHKLQAALASTYSGCLLGWDDSLTIDKPLTLISFVKDVAAFDDDTLKSLQVDGMFAHLVLTKHMSEHVDSLKGLPIRTCIDNMDARISALTSFKELSEDWTEPLPVSVKKCELASLSSAAKSACSEVRDYIAHCQKLRIERNKTCAAARKEWRNKRNSLQVQLISRKVPPCVARVASGVQQSVLLDPSEAHLPAFLSCSKLVLPQSEKEQSDAQFPFGQPVFLLAQDSSRAEVGFSNLFRERIERDRVSIQGKVAELLKFLIDNESKVFHAMNTASSSFEKGIGWQIPCVDGDENNGKQWFANEEAYGKHIVCMSEIGRMDLSHTAMPFAGLPMVIHAFTGPLAVIVVRPSIDMGMDIALWMKGADPAALESCPAFHVLPTSSPLWVPLGHVALIMPLSTKGEVLKSKSIWPAVGKQGVGDFTAWTITPCFNYNVGESDKAQQIKLGLYMKHSIASIPQSLGSDPLFKKWKGELDAL